MDDATILVSTPRKCAWCKIGDLHLDIDRGGGYRLVCDNQECGRSFAVTLGSAEKK
jgi:hypothetical protein